MMNATSKPAQHDHLHTPNRFAVLPTATRLNADTQYSGKGVTIAFLDSGFYPHPDLTLPTSRILAYHDITDPHARLNAEQTPHGWQWHGTQTSVTCAGNGFLSDGFYRGLASDAQLVLVKISEQGRIPEANIARGIRWAIENKDRYGIRIISISAGGDDDLSYRDSLADQAAEEAIKQGLVIVVAAGNSGCTDWHKTLPPASSPSVITVGGYNDGNQLDAESLALYCSSYGETPDGLVKPEIIAPAIWVAAPILPNTEAYQRAETLSKLASAPDYLLSSLSRLVGASGYLLNELARDVWQRAELPDALLDEDAETIRRAAEEALRDSKTVATHYQHVDGTSFAAPIVASVVAQMLEANPRLTPAAIKSILISTANRLRDESLIRQGYGVLNARLAVEEARRENHTHMEFDFCPPRIEAGRVVFVYHNEAAQSVALAGDFNDWDGRRTPLVKADSGIWRGEIVAPEAGRYRYKLIIDGSRWIDDPANGLKESDNYGGWNSVLNLD